MTEEMLLLAKGLLSILHKNPERYDLPKIEAAYALAYRAHDGQKRQSGEPYISHPLAVAESVAGLGLDTDSVCAALLHDTVEDCEGITSSTLAEQFGTLPPLWRVSPRSLRSPWKTVRTRRSRISVK